MEWEGRKGKEGGRDAVTSRGGEEERRICRDLINLSGERRRRRRKGGNERL